MTFREYQDYVKAGASKSYDDIKFAALALVGEVGEVCDAIKKHSIYPDDPKWDANKIIDELGDVLWQWTACANAMAITVDYIIDHNVEKLNNRHGGAGKLDTKGGKR